MKLKDFLIEDKTISENPADEDAKAADKLHGGLKSTIEDIEDALILIDRNLSGFNAPGLKHAFTDALRKGLNRQGKFDARVAHKILNNYYK